MRIDWKIVQHLILTEVKLSHKQFIAFSIYLILAFFPLPISHELKPLVLIYGFFVFLSIPLNSHLVGVQQPHSIRQFAGLSWHYLHNIFHDRKTILAAYGIYGALSCFLCIPLIFDLSNHLREIPLRYLLTFFPTLLILLAFVKIAKITVCLQNSRGHVKYDGDESGWFKLKLTLINFITLFPYFLFLTANVVMIEDGIIEEEFLPILFFVYSATGLYQIIHYTLKIWENDLHRRYNKKRSSLLLVVGVAFMSFTIINDKVDINDIGDLIKENNLAEIERLNIKGDVNKLNKIDFTWSPIMEAVSRNNTKIVEYFIKQDRTVIEARADQKALRNHEYIKGMTPLMLAVNSGSQETFELLLKNGANIHAQNEFGMTSLSVAAFRCELEMFHTLIRLGADINHSTKKDTSVIDYASNGFGCISVVEYLISKDVKYDAEKFSKKVKKINRRFYRELKHKKIIND